MSLTPDPAAESTERFLADVRAELARARAKFSGDNPTYIALGEEVGELGKAMMEEPAARVWREAVQVAVMAARCALDGDFSVDVIRASRGLDALPPNINGA